MKEIMKSSLLLTALMILAVFLVSFCLLGPIQVIRLVFELFFLAFLITMLQSLMKKRLKGNVFLSIGLEYISISALVLFYGYIMHWFMANNWWSAFIYVAVVYIPSYFLDMVSIKRDVDYINDRLEKRRNNNKV